MSAARLTAGALSLVLFGCQAPAETAAPQAPEAPTPPVAPTSPTPAETSGVRLKPGGLVIRNAGGGSSQTVELPFGMAEAAAIQMVSAVRGRAPTRARHAECGAGPLDFADWGDGLSLVFQDGRFAGWWANDQAPATHAADGGVHVGSTLAQVRVAYPIAQVSESTIGPELIVGDLFGTLSGTADTARVTALWAGVSCVFR